MGDLYERHSPSKCNTNYMKTKQIGKNMYSYMNKSQYFLKFCPISAYLCINIHEKSIEMFKTLKIFCPKY